VFHNNIFHETSFLEIIYQLPVLEDISFEGNPISRDIGVKYKILMNIPTIKHIDDEWITELDLEMAENYYTTNGYDIPNHMKYPLSVIDSEVKGVEKENISQPIASKIHDDKWVRFNDIDEDGLTWQDTEILKLKIALEKSEKRNKEILDENLKLK